MHLKEDAVDGKRVIIIVAILNANTRRKRQSIQFIESIKCDTNCHDPLAYLYQLLSYKPSDHYEQLNG